MFALVADVAQCFSDPNDKTWCDADLDGGV